ncbi:MAG TPA: hypothetical protein VKA19_02385, partial [Alphaproteobacteria bacterium]|nr:hypothetical protein [Alphaproteobacteria bacterium]
MARFDYVQTNFIRGELTPRINGRIDFDGYFDGAADLKNCIVQPFGGALRRSGTRFVAEVADSSKIVRLLPFEVTTSQTYAVEVGPSKFRFYADGERVENGGSPVEVTSSPYTEATLPNLKYTQSADIMYLANPDVQPKELARTSTTPTFSLSDFSFSDGPYLSQNITSTTLDPDGTGTSVTITASATTGINDGNGFQSGDVGRLIRWSWDGGTHWTWYEITAVNSTTSVDATRKGQSPGNHSAASEWRLGAWSDTTGWPAVVTFHDGRLWFGGTNSQPQTVRGSKSGDYTNFAPSDPDDSTVSADAAVTITINNNLVNAVRWFVSTEKGLLVGTSGPEILIRAAVTDQAFGPDNVEAVRQANWGSSADPLPVLVGRSVVFVQRNGRMVREAAFEFSVDGFTFRALNLLSEHLFRQKTDRLAFQRFGLNSIIWALREDGVPLTFTFEKEQKVYAWSPQPTGDVSAEDRVVEDIISL